MAGTPNPLRWKLPVGNKLIRDNYLKAATFQSPEWIPCSVGMFPAIWGKYRKNLSELVRQHPFIFGTLMKHRRFYNYLPLTHRPDTYYTDNWGCKWYTSQGGYVGQVVENPLADWGNLAGYKFPEPLKYWEMGRHNWFLVKRGMKMARRHNIHIFGQGERLFDRLYFLRGFDKLMRDIAVGDPHLSELISRFTQHELVITNKWLEMGVDGIDYHTDIGAQDRLIISPRQFRKWIKPMFMEIFKPVKDAGKLVYLSSDGYLLDIIDDLIECGVSIHDPQLNANKLAGIKNVYKGKMCIDLDLDRQSFPFLTPEEIDNQIASAVETLHSLEGGFMMKAEISDVTVPLENIRAICEAFEKYCIF